MRRSDRPHKDERLRDLSSHSATYVTVNELAAYWMISPRQIYKQIENGNLAAIRLGPRLLRIRTSDALEFERQSSSELMPPAAQKRWTTPQEIARHARATAAKIDIVKRF